MAKGKEREKQNRSNLVTGTDTFASMTAQDPSTARKLQSLIPSLAGDLRRELPDPTYLSSLGSKVGFLYDYNRSNGDGTNTHFFFACTASQIFLNVAGTWTAQSLPLPNGTTSTTPIIAFPQAITINNLMQISDGVNTWIFDGTFWILSGMPLPTVPPAQLSATLPTGISIIAISRAAGVVSITINTPTIIPLSGWLMTIAGVADSSFLGTFPITVQQPVTSTLTFSYDQSGLPDTTSSGGTASVQGLTIATNRYYWTSWLDQTANRGLEQSDASPVSLGTGPIVSGPVGTIPLLAIAGNNVNAVSMQITGDYRSVFATPQTVTIAGNSNSAFNAVWTTQGIPFYNPSQNITYVALPNSAAVNGGGTGGTVALSGSTQLGVTIYQRPGVVSVGHGSSTVTISTGTGLSHTAPLFTAADVGMAIYTASSPFDGGNHLFGIILSVAGNGLSCTIDRTYNGTALNNLPFVIAPVRASHWVIYASESENSQIGWQLAIIPLQPFAQTSYIDACPFISSPFSFLLPIERPVRNDPPVASLIQEVHKYRIFRRRETKPAFFNFTANEEVSGNINGSPQESTPGTDPNTQSDIVNENPYPNQSLAIRGICSHGDAIYFGTESDITPMYGQSITDFTLSQLTAFKVGVAGRFSMISTPHGLVFVSYDRKVYLYPSQIPAGLWGQGDSTQYLVEIGRPLRNILATIKTSDLGNVRLQFYNYNVRNWLVLAFQDNTSAYQTWVYDFETQGWFQLQRGVCSLAKFEVAPGVIVLVGGDAAGQVWVLDDITGTFTSNANLPVGVFRPALINWNAPDHYHVFRYVEFEVDNVLIGQSSITINYYLDPVSVDNPGTPTGTLTLSQVRGSNFFRGFPAQGTLCYRMLLEIIVAGDQNKGVIRALNIVADEASSLIF